MLRRVAEKESIGQVFARKCVVAEIGRRLGARGNKHLSSWA